MKLKFKTVLISAAFFVTSLAAKSQELVFKIDQFATSFKDTKKGSYKDAEINDIQSTILLRGSEVLIEGKTKTRYTMEKKGLPAKVSNNVMYCSYHGKDERDVAVSFVYTVNLASKEAVIEIEHNELKEFYFGTLSSSDLSMQQ